MFDYYSARGLGGSVLKGWLRVPLIQLTLSRLMIVRKHDYCYYIRYHYDEDAAGSIGMRWVTMA